MRVDLQALAGLHELARAGAAGATANLRGPTVTGTAREGRLTVYARPDGAAPTRTTPEVTMS